MMLSDDECLSDDEYSSNVQVANSDKKPLPLPILSQAEVNSSQLLGKGAFCQVSSIKSISLKPEKDADDEQQEARNLFAARYPPSRINRNLAIFGKQQETQKNLAPQPPPRLAMKKIKDLSAKNLKRAQTDLKAEFDILKSIPRHTNIIQLYAVGYDSANEEIEFLVLGRLRTTLRNRIKRWREQRGLGVWEFIGIDVKGSQDLWLERLLVLSRIAGALQFLHANKIIFRDIKPDNIGFDDNDIVRLFDFGLSKVLQAENDDDTYKLTGDTGTLRYMPREVFKGLPYGKSADVYSFSIVMYEVLSLKVPYSELPRSQFKNLVFKQGCRPQVDPGWPEKLQKLMTTMWDDERKLRPESQEVFSTLEEMLRGSDSNLFPAFLIVPCE
jgi:serine/threonine protein kinase